MLTVDKSIGMIKKPNRSIDFMKGILTIFVVIGHSLSGNLREVFPRYMIYSFHIPDVGNIRVDEGICIN